MLSVVTEIEELEDLRAEWSQLWRDDPRATPFQSPEWLLPWWRHIFAGGQLWTIIQRRDGRLVSLLPLFRYGADREHLTFMGTGISDYLDLIGAPIASIPGDWTDASLEEIRPGSSLADLSDPQPCSVCPVTRLPATMQELLAQIDSKLAIDVHRSKNRLQRAGSVTIERANSLKDLFALHQARWESKSEQGMLAELRPADLSPRGRRGFRAPRDSAPLPSFTERNGRRRDLCLHAPPARLCLSQRLRPGSIETEPRHRAARPRDGRSHQGRR